MSYASATLSRLGIKPLLCNKKSKNCGPKLQKVELMADYHNYTIIQCSQATSHNPRTKRLKKLYRNLQARACLVVYQRRPRHDVGMRWACVCTIKELG